MEVNFISILRRAMAGHCELCHANSVSDYGLCTGCRDDLPLILKPCQRCGVALAHEGLCGRCLQDPVVIDSIIAPLAYRYPVMELIKNIKYNQRVTLIPGLASVLVARLLRRADDLPQVMVPVPLSYYRWVSRGFNQAIQICKFLRSQLQIPYDAGLVRRVKNTPPLFPLTPEERARQLRGAFAVVTKVSSRSVAIVDDVVTTGSTVNEIARILRSRGVEHIEVWALARTC